MTNWAISWHFLERERERERDNLEDKCTTPTLTESNAAWWKEHITNHISHFIHPKHEHPVWSFWNWFLAGLLWPLHLGSCCLCLSTHRFCGCSWRQWWGSRSWWPGWCLWSQYLDPSALYTPAPTPCPPWSCVLCCHAETNTHFILNDIT